MHEKLINIIYTTNGKPSREATCQIIMTVSFFHWHVGPLENLGHGMQPCDMYTRKKSNLQQGLTHLSEYVESLNSKGKYVFQEKTFFKMFR